MLTADENLFSVAIFKLGPFMAGRTPMASNDVTLKRLSFIKYLYSIAVEQSTKPEPLCSASILTFHDSIELFLQLASEHLNIGKAQPAFVEYWDMLSPKLKTGELFQKESIRRLNKARVALKHNGILPSKLDIEAFRASATNFFEENTTIVFDISFSEISLIDLVQCNVARQNLKEAEILIGSRQLEEAIDKIAIAFEQILSDYKGKCTTQYSESPFDFGQRMTFWGLSRKKIKTNEREFHKEMERIIDDVRETFEAIQNALKVITMGIDYRRYSKFKMYMPHLNQTMDGKYHVVRNEWHPSIMANESETKHCIDFVIETSIKLYDFNFGLPVSI